MNLSFSYLGRSSFDIRGETGLLRLAPNLSREPVAFDAPLLRPLRFREAVSALHDVVVSDLRFKPRDKTAYEAWKKNEVRRLATVRTEARKAATAAVLERQKQPLPPDFLRLFEKCRKRYWDARLEYSDYLRAHNMELWRVLMPCDPVITVADDALLFECFSADESSYGCLRVDRGAGFGESKELKLGTTNVDYSWDLYRHFQELRSYRETRFRVDPAGFEVATRGTEQLREEKIDLPDGWLRGFLQLQGAMGLPMRRVTLSRDAVYSLLAFLRRHKERKSPRALRFELLDGRPPRLVLEPWEVAIDSKGTYVEGGDSAPIRVWGKRRLLALARVLPLAESFDVYLLGTGLPHFWVAKMGEMTLTLGLSGWTTNDWTRSSALDLLAPPVSPPDTLVADARHFLRGKRSATLDEVVAHTKFDPPTAAAALLRLAHTGQAIYDLPGGVYRWRQVMSAPLAELQLGEPGEEMQAARAIVQDRQLVITVNQEAPGGGTLLAGRHGKTEIEALLDKDGAIRKAKCGCSHHYRFGIRKGPCRHILALRWKATMWTGKEVDGTWGSWYERMRRWAGR